MMDKGFQGRRTLAGCQIVATGPCFRIFREYRHLPAVAVKPGQVLLWDNRFRVEIKLPKGGVRKDLMVEPMGPAGWKAYGTLQQNNETAELRTRLAGLPAAARYALPVIRHKQALIALPWPEKAAKRPDFMFPAAFSPRNPLIHESFPVVSPAKDIIY
jgi:hypothetical protein